MINLTDKISCPKCNMKIDTKTELDRHTDDLVQDKNFDKILEVNSQNWDLEVLQSEMLVIVEFWHTSCQSAKNLGHLI